MLPLPLRLLHTLYRRRGDVAATGLLRPLLQHLRFRLHLPLVLLEAAAMPCLFHPVVGSWRAVVLRFGASYALSLAVGAAVEAHARRQFLQELAAGALGGKGLGGEVAEPEPGKKGA